MAFEQVPIRTVKATAITDLVVTLTSPDPRDPSIQPSAGYKVGVLYNTGEIGYLEGNLVIHITPAEVTQLLAFMASLRTRAINLMLPP